MNLSSVTSVSGKSWIYKKFNSTDINTFVEKYSLTQTVAKLLSIRNKKIEDIESFLNPKIKNLLPNPMVIKDMKNAVDRTFLSIKNKDLVGIFGDYDVDGATSTALLARYFLSIKQKIKTYIPDRQTEGYGPSVNGFKNLIEANAKTIFTVDCGTLSYEPIELAQKTKVDVIVLDHHQSDTNLPNACAIVNPNRYDDTSGLNYLCAAGVCFVFLIALNKKLRDENWFNKNNIPESKTAAKASAGVYPIPPTTPNATKALIPMPGANPTGHVLPANAIIKQAIAVATIVAV